MNYSTIREDFETSNFWEHMKFEFLDLKVGTASIKLNLREELENVQGILHGGAIMSLIDTSMGMAARSLGSDKVSTIQLETKFIKPVTSGGIIATSKVLHESKSTSIMECRVTNEFGELIALSTSTFKNSV